jgi:hypothetical protein
MHKNRIDTSGAICIGMFVGNWYYGIISALDNWIMTAWT